MRRVVRLIEFRKARRSGKAEGFFPGQVDPSSGFLRSLRTHLAGFVMTHHELCGISAILLSARNSFRHMRSLRSSHREHRLFT